MDICIKTISEPRSRGFDPNTLEAKTEAENYSGLLSEFQATQIYIVRLCLKVGS